MAVAKIAFLFPGQGAQTVGMGRTLCDSSPAAARVFGQADAILGYELSAICFEGPADTLNATEHCQPALLVCSIAALAAMEEQDPSAAGAAAACAGLSLGEYTAMVYAGSLTFADGLRIVRERGLAMQAAADAQPSGMVSILGLETESVAALCDAARQRGEVLQVANLLCPGNVVISGHRASCEQAMAIAESHGAMRAVPLAVAGAFHTPIMQTAEIRLAAALTEVKINAPRVPVISNVDARPHADAEELRDVLIRQVCNPVLWSDSMQSLVDQGFDTFLEIGTGRVLRGLMKRIARRVVCDGYPE